MEDFVMKNFCKGLLVAFVGFMLVVILAASVWCLVGVWFLQGYAAVAAFTGAAFTLVADVMILYKLGKGCVYVKGNV